MRRIFTAFAIFAFAGGLLALAEAKKPTKLAVLEKQETNAPPVVKEKPRAKKYLPVSNFGGY